ncbi:MAG: hypothetical protein AB8H03_02830 [Saprospiraceae bacterium]
MYFKKQTYLFTLVILIGCLLRLIWVEDMEWKYDEWWMYTHAMLVPLEGVWQSVGMKSGAGIINPGLSVWVFSLIGYFVETPLGMARGVQVLNVIALLGFIFFVKKSFKGEEQQQWYWALALLAANPLYIIFSRKIWAQDVLPIFCLLFIVGHFYRKKKWGAFTWGMIGAMSGQIHMSGFFFAFGMFLLSTFFDYKRKVKWQWWFWFTGSVIGSIGLLPWVYEMIYNRGVSSTSWENLYKFDFYIYSFIDPLGLNTMYSLREHFWDFIKMPFVFGMPTYLVAVGHLILIGVALKLLQQIFYLLQNVNKLRKENKLVNRLLYKSNATEFYLLATLFSLGILMSFSGVKIRSHYLIIAYPFLFVYVVKLLFSHKKILAVLIAVQLFISICLLTFIHVNGGAEKGDYGKAYHLQTETPKKVD